MSQNIEERILGLQFDNATFEKNIGTSLKSIDKLNKSLNMEGAVKGIDNLTKTANDFNLNGLANAADTIASRFTTMGIVSTTALINIANQAINTAKQVVKSLSIDPIKAGFNEYELKMGSIQTIIASTGESLLTVNKYLDELNTYSDRTIYSFSDMTQNIGKFTNAGVGLEKSVKAIQGISNAAAVAGANSNEASRAMYNFAQALSAGYVKLIDWKSIENANMATVEFKQQLIDTAVATGSLKKTSDGYYKTLKGTVISATKNFNDSLQDQWMTSEVLIETLGRYSDETTDIGKKAFAAAQDVKTLTQLYDTLKESAQSGWAQTWQIIVGDFEEAKVLMTMLSNGIGGMIQDSADARNYLLQGWKDLGGRDSVINGLVNIFKVLERVMFHVSSAFRQVFPKTTSEQLATLSKAFENFTKLLNSDKIAGPLHNIFKTFRGLFSIFSIFGQGVKAVADILINFLAIFHPVGYTFLEVTGAIGDYIYNIDQAMKKSGIFSTIVETISMALARVRDFLVKVKDTVKGLFDKSDIKLVVNFSTAFEFLGRVLSSAGRLIEGALGKISPLLKLFIDKVKEVFVGLDFSKIMDIVNGGLFATILFNIKNFVKKLSGVTDSSKGILDSIKSIIDGVGDSLKAWQQNLKADTLMKIAGAIAILTASVIALAMVDTDRLNSALVGIGVLFAQLITSLAVFDTITSAKGFVGMGAVTTQMIGLATAILLLAVAVEKLGKLNWDELNRGLTGVASLAAILVGSSIAMKYASKNLKKSVGGLITFSIAIYMLTYAVKALGKIELHELQNGLLSVGALMLTIAGFLKLVGNGKLSVGTGLAIIELSAALMLFANAVKSMGSLELHVLQNGLLSIGAILTMLSVFVNTTGNASKVVSTGVGLIALGTAMNIFAMAVERFGKLDIMQLQNGLVAFGLALGAVTIAVGFMPKNMISIGIGMMGVGAALLMISNAVKNMGQMSMAEVGKGLLVLAGSLTAIAVAVNFMNGAVVGAAALLIVSAALMALAPVMKIFGSMSLGDIGKSILALAASLAAITLIAIPLGFVAPALLLAAAAIGAFGIACTLLGSGLLVMITIANLGSATLIDMLKTFGAAVPEIAKLVLNILVSIVQSIATATPQIVSMVVGMIVAFLQTVSENLPSIISSGMTIILSFLQGIADNMQQIVETGMTIVINLINGVSAKLPELIDAGFKLIISFINGLADAIKTNTPILLEAVGNLAGSIIEGLASGILGGIKQVGDSLLDVGKNALQGLKDFLGIHSPSTVLAEVGANTTQGFANGMDSESLNATTTLSTLALNMLNQLALTLPLYFQTGVNSILMYTNGVRSQTGFAVVIISTLMMTLVSIGMSYRPQFVDVGVQLVQGFIEGIRSQIEAAAWAAAEMARAASAAAKAALDVRSPSRVFAWIGNMVGAGLVNGIDASAKFVAKSATDMSNLAITKVNDSLQKIIEVASSDINNEPVIKPVIDLSDVQRGSSAIANLLGGNKLNVNATIDKANNAIIENNKKNVPTNDNTTSNDDRKVVVEFNQTNTSPKALPSGEIYRNTNNALARLKEGLTNV